MWVELTTTEKSIYICIDGRSVKNGHYREQRRTGSCGAAEWLLYYRGSVVIKTRLLGGNAHGAEGTPTAGRERPRSAAASSREGVGKTPRLLVWCCWSGSAALVLLLVVVVVVVAAWSGCATWNRLLLLLHQSSATPAVCFSQTT